MTTTYQHHPLGSRLFDCLRVIEQSSHDLECAFIAGHTALGLAAQQRKDLAVRFLRSALDDMAEIGVAPTERAGQLADELEPLIELFARLGARNAQVMVASIEQTSWENDHVVHH